MRKTKFLVVFENGQMVEAVLEQVNKNYYWVNADLELSFSIHEPTIATVVVIG